MISSPYEIRFGPFVIDRLRQQLLHGRDPIRLRPKTWAVLVHLASRPGELVTAEEILDAVWRDTTVTAELPGVSIRELRRALGDDRKKPRYIETVPCRGYRFIAPLRSDPVLPAADPTPSAPPAAVLVRAPFVGRERELTELNAAFAAVRSGSRKVVFVAGEAGIGKSSLLETFLLRLRERPSWPFLLGRGQCIAQQSEAYLGLLDAVAGLCQDDPSGTALRRLERFAPLWLPALPEFGDQPRTRPGATVAATPERLVRSLSQALEAISSEIPVVLVLEDLHWVDQETVRFLQVLAERVAPARLLTLCTYRPLELALHLHPLREVKGSLLARQRCQELLLDGLPEPDVRGFVLQRWGNLDEAEMLAAWLSQRTEGSPLFLNALAEQLERAQFLRRKGDGWLLQPG